MNIMLMLNQLKHRKDISSYNNNYYQLPFTIDGYIDMLHEDYDRLTEEFCGYSVGVYDFKENKYHPEFYLHTPEHDDGLVIIDFDKISEENKWT